MTTEQVATIKELRALLKSWPEWMLHSFRVSKAHEDAPSHRTNYGRGREGTEYAP